MGRDFEPGDKRESMLKQRLFPILTAVCLLIGSVPIFAQEVPPPTLGDFDPASLEGIDPADFPIIPLLTDHARAIFERGQALETPRDPHMFSKVGDSMTASVNFLTAFGDGEGAYDLGDYPELEPTVAFFNASTDADGHNAFNRENFANSLGFSTASALDSTWAVQGACEPNENPLACEYRASNSAFALIMFGTNDVMVFDAMLFDFFLRQGIVETMAADVVPVLYTMPIRPEAPDQSRVFNQIILKIARDYDLPVINLAAALEALPNYGVDLEDTLHLTEPEPPGTVATFTEESLGAGYTVRNLVTLQALSALLTELDLLPSEN